MEFFWSAFFRSPTEYGNLQNKSPHSFQTRENTDQKKLQMRTITQCLIPVLQTVILDYLMKPQPNMIYGYIVFKARFPAFDNTEILYTETITVILRNIILQFWWK